MSQGHQNEVSEPSQQGRYPEFPGVPTGPAAASTARPAPPGLGAFRPGNDPRGAAQPAPQQGPVQPSTFGPQAVAPPFSHGPIGTYPFPQGMMHHDQFPWGPVATHGHGAVPPYSTTTASVPPYPQHGMPFITAPSYPHGPAYHHGLMKPCCTQYPYQAGPYAQASLPHNQAPQAYNPSFQPYRPNAQTYSQATQSFNIPAQSYNQNPQAINIPSRDIPHTNIGENNQGQLPTGPRFEGFAARENSRNPRNSRNSFPTQPPMVSVTDQGQNIPQAPERPATLSSRPLIPTVEPFQPRSLCTPSNEATQKSEAAPTQTPSQSMTTSGQPTHARMPSATQGAPTEPSERNSIEASHRLIPTVAPFMPTQAQTQMMNTVPEKGATAQVTKKENSQKAPGLSIQDTTVNPLTAPVEHSRQKDTHNASASSGPLNVQQATGMAQVTVESETIQQTPLTPEIQPVHPDKTPPAPANQRVRPAISRFPRPGSMDEQFLREFPLLPAAPEIRPRRVLLPSLMDPDNDELVFGPYLGLVRPLPPFRDPPVPIPTASTGIPGETQAESLMRAARAAAELCREDDILAGRVRTENPEHREKEKQTPEQREADRQHASQREGQHRSTTNPNYTSNEGVPPDPFLPDARIRAENPAYQAWVSIWETVIRNMAGYANGYSNCQKPLLKNNRGLGEFRLPRHRPDWPGRDHPVWGVPTWRQAETWGTGTAHRDFLNNSCAVPFPESIPTNNPPTSRSPLPHTLLPRTPLPRTPPPRTPLPRTPLPWSRGQIPWSDEITPVGVSSRPPTPAPFAEIRDHERSVLYEASAARTRYQSNETSSQLIAPPWHPALRVATTTLRPSSELPISARMGLSGTRTPIVSSRRTPLDLLQAEISDAPTRTASAHSNRSIDSNMPLRSAEHFARAQTLFTEGSRAINESPSPLPPCEDPYDVEHFAMS
ncbi:uncharacterized protein N7459_008639 [Penicillium hispanicum]|uniref:Uncharacterized protein n=1 Tax=Penicillium cinerascens TaxID=70096 RepID=A0A9W9MFP1_9EURO|nr:uncharacterized protein N7459_008639 [Penicillium hispanicum]XP_058307230.1 uncharacterized protein N7498_007919 [Penicillium cinerascens]KAJ5198802.1 hypothetical protein N7498_007919 [Penicillium cinerascens]KAJ5574212.1 hypothetical protein N7459_008639 [Penicillium hispanicum]